MNFLKTLTYFPGTRQVLQKHDWFFWCQRALRWKAETELSQLSTFSKLNLLLQFQVVSGRAGEKQKGVSPLSSTPALPHHCNMTRRVPQRPLCWGFGFQPVEQLGSIGTFRGWSFMGERSVREGPRKSTKSLAYSWSVFCFLAAMK